MKIRFLTSLSVCAMLLTCMSPIFTASAEINSNEPLAASADIERSMGSNWLTYGDYSYQYKDDGTVEIEQYNGSGGSLIIPKTINGKKVTSIGWTAFRDCTSLTSVTIPDYVTYIGTDAFSSCTGLTSINIPNSVTTIGQSTFSFCTGLTSVTLPSSVKVIGPYAFNSCTKLSSVTFYNSEAYIGDFAFRSCPNLTIYGYKSSTAEKYAKNNNIPFVAIDKTDTGKSKYGEIDGDGKITSTDSLLILRQSVNLERFTGTKLKLCDVDGDSKVTSADALEVMRYSVTFPTSTKIGKVYAQ